MQMYYINQYIVHTYLLPPIIVRHPLPIYVDQWKACSIVINLYQKIQLTAFNFRVDDRFTFVWDYHRRCGEGPTVQHMCYTSLPQPCTGVWSHVENTPSRSGKTMNNSSSESQHGESGHACTPSRCQRHLLAPSGFPRHDWGLRRPLAEKNVSSTRNTS